MVYGHACGCTLTRGELTMINFMVNRTGTDSQPVTWPNITLGVVSEGSG